MHLTPRVRGPVAGLRLMAFFGSLVVIGCKQEPQIDASTQETQIDARIWRQMRCIECQDGEQAAVVSMGVSAIPGLRQFLLEGPPDTTVARQDSALSAPLSAPLSEGSPTRVAPQPPAGRGRRATQPPVIAGTATQPPAGYVQARIDDFVAMYRIRSALALGLIGGDSARKALCQGKAMQFRPDVQRMIDSSLVLLNGTCP